MGCMCYGKKSEDASGLRELYDEQHESVLCKHDNYLGAKVPRLIATTFMQGNKLAGCIVDSRADISVLPLSVCNKLKLTYNNFKRIVS